MGLAPGLGRPFQLGGLVLTSTSSPIACVQGGARLVLLARNLELAQLFYRSLKCVDDIGWGTTIALTSGLHLEEGHS